MKKDYLFFNGKNNVSVKKSLKEDFGIILGGLILIIWGGLISGLPDSYVYSFFGIHDPSNTIYQWNEMDIKDWTERMMIEFGINFVLFAVHYLISVLGIIVATFGGIRAIKSRTKPIHNI